MENYHALADLLAQKSITREFLEQGCTEKQVRSKQKKAIEDARFVLPNACDTKMILTMNARSLMNFFSIIVAAIVLSGKSVRLLMKCCGWFIRLPQHCSPECRTIPKLNWKMSRRKTSCGKWQK